MGSNTKPEASPEAIERATSLWNHFTKGVKWSVISTVICLALMALFLL